RGSGLGCRRFDDGDGTPDDRGTRYSRRRYRHFDVPSDLHACGSVEFREKVTDSSRAMDRRKWLLRLIYVRLFAFSGFIIVPLLTGKFGGAQHNDMIKLMGAVLALSACWFALLRLNTHYVWQSYAQIFVDLFLITWTVNRTDGIDSYFSNLYFLEIVMSSILLERRGAFVAGTLSSVIHFAHLNLLKLGLITSTGENGLA